MKKYYISPETIIIPVEEVLTVSNSANYSVEEEHAGDVVSWKLG